LCSEAVENSEEEAVVHFVEVEKEDESESGDEETSDVESIFGSLMGSDYSSGSDKDLGENSETDESEHTLAKTDSCTIETGDIPTSEDEEIDKINFERLSLSVKAKSEQYAKEAAENPKASEETTHIINKALSKFPNPVPCPTCGRMFKNERGVKMHSAIMH
jgi:hypothetical protein